MSPCNVMEMMRQTRLGMRRIFKQTSLGMLPVNLGMLAVNVVEC
jgi:hypothetical protein